jgi:hypothetical protein
MVVLTENRRNCPGQAVGNADFAEKTADRADLLLLDHQRKSAKSAFSAFIKKVGLSRYE